MLSEFVTDVTTEASAEVSQEFPLGLLHGLVHAIPDIQLMVLNTLLRISCVEQLEKLLHFYCGVSFSEDRLQLIALRADVPEVYKFRSYVDQALVREAASHGAMRMLDRCLELGYTWSRIGCECVATVEGIVDQPETLAWLLDRGCPWSEWVFTFASRNGHLRSIKYGVLKGYPWDSKICHYAASEGRLDVIMWLRSMGCKWDQWVSAFAAEGGHLDTLKWLVSNGCPWDEAVVELAAKHGHLELLMWVKAQRSHPKFDNVCRNAAMGGRPEVLEWARSIGCPCDEDVADMVSELGNVELLKWMVLNGYPCDDRVTYGMVVCNDLDTLKWLICHGCPCDLDECIRSIEQTGCDDYTKMLDWLLSLCS